VSDSKSAVNDQGVLASNDKAQTKHQEQESETAVELAGNSKQPVSMHVKVYSPFRDYYDDQALSISSDNLTGPFDILPRHHNFISLLTKSSLIIRPVGDKGTGPIEIRISGGLMHVKSDEVLVFLDV
jgi:hypothetical protein